MQIKRNFKLLFPYTTNANLEVIETFYNLEDLTTNNYSIIELFKYSKTIKTVSFRDASENLKFPYSVKTVHFQCSSTFKYIQSFLEQNPFIREVSTELMNWHEFAQLLHKFPHIKFNSICYYDHFFNFKQFYGYLHPQYKQPCCQSSEPNHILYGLLYQRLTDKFKLLRPYLKVVTYEFQSYCEQLLLTPALMMDQISTFDEFQQLLIKTSKPQIDLLEASHFYRVFNYQLAQCADSEYLRIVLSCYDEAFQLGGNVDQAVTKVKGMSALQRQTIKRQSYFNHCKQNWQSPIMPEDFIP